MDRAVAGMNIGRRRFLQATAGGLAWWLAGRPVIAQTGYRVGVGRSSDAYTATRRAIDASGEWPAPIIAGRTVVVKPNLVNSKTAEMGVTTDPQVVRAIVDLSLEAGAARVLVVEGGRRGAPFTACGYDFFNGYDPDGRVALVDLSTQPVALFSVSRSMTYRELYLPTLLMEDDVIYISVAKLKCHVNAVATLATKNSFGLPPIPPYMHQGLSGRFSMHQRSVSQSVVDLNLARPIDFAVVDGIWGLEGDGPLSGMPVRMDMVIAGHNALAVDRVCLAAMGISQHAVQHLQYAARWRLGPASIGAIQVTGDMMTTRSFVPARAQPVVEYPRASPRQFAPVLGQRTAIWYWVDTPCLTRVEIIRTEDHQPTLEHVRTIRNWARRPTGTETLEWDGRDDNGQIVTAGLYSIRICARYEQGGAITYATGRTLVATSGS